MKMILFAGLPGTGKSTLAESVGRQIGIPVFAKDWLEGSLLQSSLKAMMDDKRLGFAGYELLTVLAERQFMLNQSVILDSVTSTQAIRTKWYQLAKQYEAEWRVIECVCSDENLHRARLNSRQRGIPGWHELKWADVEKVKGYYPAWEEDHLVLDMVNPLGENVFKARAYCE
jgi:predicted kinase